MRSLKTACNTSYNLRLKINPLLMFCICYIQRYLRFQAKQTNSCLTGRAISHGLYLFTVLIEWGEPNKQRLVGSIGCRNILIRIIKLLAQTRRGKRWVKCKQQLLDWRKFRSILKPPNSVESAYFEESVDSIIFLLILPPRLFS